MEKKSVLTIVLLILVLVLGGFIIYDKVLNKPSESNVKNDTVSLFENIAKNRETMQEYDYGIKIVVDKNGNVYYTADKVDNATGVEDSYTIEGYADSDGNVLKGYKLPIANVVFFYHGVKGNGGSHEYVFVKEDKTIGKLVYDVNDDTVVINSFTETVPGYTNIIGILPSNSFDGHNYKLFDIEGKIYE